MVTFLSLCFSWAFIVALVLVTVIAFLDLLYNNERFVPCYYPEHPRAQITVCLMGIVIFILWQMPLFTEGHFFAKILMARFVIIIAWLFIARFLLKWLIRSLVMLTVRSFLNDIEKNNLI